MKILPPPPADCPFCAILGGSAPATVRGNWPMVLAFVPLNPVTSGHTLIVPKVHFSRPHEARALFRITSDAAVDYAQERGDDYNLIVNAGPAATQSVDHLHIHYLPRHSTDGLTLPWSNQYRPGSGPEVR